MSKDSRGFYSPRPPVASNGARATAVECTFVGKHHEMTLDVKVIAQSLDPSCVSGRTLGKQTIIWSLRLLRTHRLTSRAHAHLQPPPPSIAQGGLPGAVGVIALVTPGVLSPLQGGSSCFEIQHGATSDGVKIRRTFLLSRSTSTA